MTANKQLLSQHGAELLQTAEDNGTYLRFEASAVGAVPVIKVLRESLAAAEVTTRHGHRQRHDQLHPLGHDADRRRVRTDAQEGPGARVRRGRPDGGRERQGRGRQDGDPLIDRLPQPRHAGRRRARGHRRRHRRRCGARQAARPGAQAARCGQDHRRARQRPRLPGFIPADHPLAGVSGAYNAVFLESDTFDRIMLFGPAPAACPRRRP